MDINTIKPNPDNYKPSDFQLFFPVVFSMSMRYEPEIIDEEKLHELLQRYGLDDHFDLFANLAKWLETMLSRMEGQRRWEKEAVDKWHNENIDLIRLSEAFNKNKIKWFEIRTSLGVKIKISDEGILEEFGENLYEKYYVPHEKRYPNKESPFWQKAKGRNRRPKLFYLALTCFDILNYLNKKTNLTSGSVFLSNIQGKFIFELLQFIDVILNEEKIVVLEEDYIRSLLNNYKSLILDDES